MIKNNLTQQETRKRQYLMDFNLNFNEEAKKTKKLINRTLRIEEYEINKIPVDDYSQESVDYPQEDGAITINTYLNRRKFK